MKKSECGWYLLDDDNKVIPADDVRHYVEWLSQRPNGPKLWVEQVGNAIVSTVFLGLDHDHFGTHFAPIVFETMIFGGDLEEEYQTRGVSYEEAWIMHQEALAFLRNRAKSN